MNTEIFFDPIQHKYTDELGNLYISATTLIGKYEEKFDEKKYEIARACERIGKPHMYMHPKHEKYKGKSASQILAGWDKTRDDACNLGNAKHDYLETSIKKSSGYYKVFGATSGHSTGKLYTVPNIMKNPSYGRINLELFKRYKVHINYPEIYDLIEILVKDGWRLYAEVCTYNTELLISGLIDLLAVKDGAFIIVDWKTNKYPLTYVSGYWDKDKYDNAISYIQDDKTFKYPLQDVPCSVGYKYGFQLSLYDYLTELFGLEFGGNYLCHIRHHNYEPNDDKARKDKRLIGRQVVDIHNMKYYKSSIQSMVTDYTSNSGKSQIRFSL